MAKSRVTNISGERASDDSWIRFSSTPKLDSFPDQKSWKFLQKEGRRALFKRIIDLEKNLVTKSAFAEPKKKEVLKTVFDNTLGMRRAGASGGRKT